jgi:hypothetical protein
MRTQLRPAGALPENAASPAPTPTRYAGPIWTLILLAPFIAEILSGATRLSVLFAFIPETMVWGCGALLCRELVRRWRAGGVSLLLLGLGLSIAEEFVIQQTSLAPLPFPGAHADYGRAFGINWLYFLFMLGYESVFVVLVPVAVTELLFPAARREPWLRRRGFIATCFVFVAGSLLAGYAWIKRARPSLHAAPYHAPAITVAAGVFAIFFLGVMAHALRRSRTTEPDPTPACPAFAPRRVVHPWLAAPAAFVLAAGWNWLIALEFTPVRYAAWIPITLGCAWALVAFVLIHHWSKASGWDQPGRGEIARWALAFGAILPMMTVSYLSIKGWKHADLVFKVIVNALGFAALVWLGVKVRRRGTRLEPDSETAG